MEVMLNHRHDLWFGHFVSRFQHNDPRDTRVLLKSRFQFALGLAGAKDQDGFGITKMRNDRVVVACELPGICSLARIIGGNFPGFERTMVRLSRTPGLFFRG